MAFPIAFLLNKFVQNAEELLRPSMTDSILLNNLCRLAGKQICIVIMFTWSIYDLILSDEVTGGYWGIDGE